MIKIKFGNEHLNLAKGLCGVYKIVVNERWFYIGSSVDLKRRLSTWKHYFNNPQVYSKNRSICLIMKIAEEIRFEIVEAVTDGSNPKIREDQYIKAYFDDENCLNLVPDAVNGRGRKLPIGVLRRDKKLRGEPTKSKRVAQFDLNGNLVMRHQSIGAAARYLKCKADPIRWILQGEQGAYKGYVFKQILEDGSFIEPPKFIRKEREGRLFYQIGGSGDIIKSFTSTRKAAKAVGGSHRNIQKVLNGVRKYKTVKGYSFKYA